MSCTALCHSTGGLKALLNRQGVHPQYIKVLVPAPADHNAAADAQRAVQMGSAHAPAEPRAPASSDPTEPAARRTGRKRKAVNRLDSARKLPRPRTPRAVTGDGREAPTAVGPLAKANAVKVGDAAEGGALHGLPDSRRRGSSLEQDQPRPVLRCRFCAAHGESVASSPAHRASCWYHNSCACSACGKVHRRNLAVVTSQRRRAAQAALTL